ncbi:MAG: histidine kinase, partial [Betaproteobacteria bacterium]
MNNPLSAPSAELIEVRETWARKYTHPLEVMVPFFRRYPKSLLRDLIYTFVWNTLLAAFFTAVGVMFTGRLPAIGTWFSNNLLIANCIGYLFHAAYFLSDRTIDPWLRRQSAVILAIYHFSLSILCVVIGFAIAGQLLGWPVLEWVLSRGYIVTIVTTSVLISGVMGAIFFVAEHRAVAEMQLHKERARVATVEREAMLANLKALQAQIEPHFLFNTLANVVGLIHSQPDTAKRMLEQFIAYLRASLASTREQETTLGNEFQLMANFLAILQIRMGDRLRVELDLPADLAAQHLPSMLLQPLLENAIKHGL